MKVLQFMQEVSEIVYNFHVKKGKTWRIHVDYEFNDGVTAWVCVYKREDETIGGMEYFCDENYCIKSQAGSEAVSHWLKQFK